MSCHHFFFLSLPQTRGFPKWNFFFSGTFPPQMHLNPVPSYANNEGKKYLFQKILEGFSVLFLKGT